MMQVEGEASRSRPAYAAQKIATTRPPQPQSGQRHDQHAGTDPADDLAPAYDARPCTSVATLPAHGDAYRPTRFRIAHNTGAQIRWIFRDGFRRFGQIGGGRLCDFSAGDRI